MLLSSLLLKINFLLCTVLHWIEKWFSSLILKYITVSVVGGKLFLVAEHSSSVTCLVVL